MRWLRNVSRGGPLALFLALAAVPAAAAHVRILAPAEGARLDAMNPTELIYEVEPGPRGEHVHVYVDGKEVGILRQLKGSHALQPLLPGQRTVCIKVVNKAHVPIGVEQCVRVEVE
ncbi:MAG: hypothetical protein HYZ20_18720 [Burkholderiales bacterium]|nr:hypothetical protein [Burkholderiales bacterium]